MDIANSEIKHTHCDSGIFTADVFQEDCAEKHQSKSFSGVGDHHKNAHAMHAMHAMQTIMYRIRTFMLHVSLQ